MLTVCRYDTHQCPRNQGCYSQSRCARLCTRHRPSNVPARQTST